jgi:hypothetical protein
MSSSEEGIVKESLLGSCGHTFFGPGSESDRVRV